MSIRAPVILLAALLAGCSTAPTPTQTNAPGVLSQAQAHFLAEKLAVARYDWFFRDRGIERSSPPRLVDGEWRWRLRRGSGGGDMVITVTFAPDGTSPVVDYEYENGSVYIRR